jgi:hypothetical protein
LIPWAAWVAKNLARPYATDTVVLNGNHYSNVHIDDLVDILAIGNGDYAFLLVWKVIA